MPERLRRLRPSGPGVPATALAVLMLVLGAAHWFEPFLTRRAQPVVSVAVPPALSSFSFVELRPGAPVCMTVVTIPSNSHDAEFTARPLDPRAATLPPIELVLTAPGYSARALDRSGVPGAQIQQIAPPVRTALGEICLIDRGRRAIELYGTSEPRTLARAPTTVAGEPSAAEVSLQFLGKGAPSLVDRLGEVFGHASNLTEGLVPTWLIWTVALLVAFGVPIALLAAFYTALREDAPHG